MAAHPLLEDDDLLAEILLHLPPTPSSLLRASAVCKRWRHLLTASDRAFLRRFHARHRRDAPLLGVVFSDFKNVTFIPTMDPPDRIRPTGRFCSLRVPRDDFLCRVVGCRDGLVLIAMPMGHRFVVWDPVSGVQHAADFPRKVVKGIYSGEINSAVFRSAAAGGDDAGFQVVLVGTDEDLTRAYVCVYSSETGKWGNLILASLPPVFKGLHMYIPGVLAGDSFYWVLCGDPDFYKLLEFDLNKKRLAVVDVPVDLIEDDHQRFWVMRAEDGGLGFATLSNLSVRIWKKKDGRDAAVSGWVLVKTVELGNLLSLTSTGGEEPPLILGFAEDHNVMFLKTTAGIFMVHLKSMEFKKLPEERKIDIVYPFASVYAAGMGISDENNEDEQDY